MIQKEEQAKAKISALQARMEKARKLIELFNNSSWVEMENWLASEILRTKDSLCSQALAPGETTALRGQYWALKRVHDLPETTRAELESAALEARALRERLDKLHTRRPDRYGASLEAVQQMSDT